MDAQNTTAGTLQDVLVREVGMDYLLRNAKSILEDMYHTQCTFENVFWKRLKDMHDGRFEEYNKATGLGRSAMCLVDGAYERRAILCAALEAYIEKLKEDGNES